MEPPPRGTDTLVAALGVDTALVTAPVVHAALVHIWKHSGRKGRGEAGSWRLAGEGTTWGKRAEKLLTPGVRQCHGTQRISAHTTRTHTRGFIRLLTDPNVPSPRNLSRFLNSGSCTPGWGAEEVARD